MKRFGQTAVRVAMAMCMAVAFLGAGCDDGDDDDDDVVAPGDDPAVVDDDPVVVADVVHSAGNATVLGTFEFDFDNGSGGTTPMPAGDKADMFWRRVNATDSQLVSRNGAKFAAMGVVDYGAVSKAQVQTLALSSAAIAHTALPAGTVVAFKTDAGRFGKFKVNGFSGNQDMALSWTSWD